MLELHQFDLQESLQLLKLDEKELEILKAFKPALERDIEAIVERFYAHILTVPNLKEIIERHSSVDKLKVTMRAYLLSLFPDKIDENFMAWRVKIGQVHKRVNLPPFYYLSANQVLFDELIPRIYAFCRKKTDQALRLSLALLRIMSFDMQIVMASYIHSYMK